MLDLLTDGPMHDGLLLVARCLFSALFVASARDKLRGDPQEIAMIRALGLPAPERLETLTGLFELVAAALLLIGCGTRIAALMLAAFLTFLTLVFLHYWSFKGPLEGRQAMRNAFYGNWAVVGGLLTLTVAGPGRLALLTDV